MEWQPIETAPREGTIKGRDADGFERITFFDGDWWYLGTEEDDDQNEYECEVRWEPIAWCPA